MNIEILTESGEVLTNYPSSDETVWDAIEKASKWAVTYNEVGESSRYHKPAVKCRIGGMEYSISEMSELVE